ncbi:MAG TPA: DinB family protein [Candidatus Binatia bacterium]|nr:DinB family protein [Candidatus Binatia bacterium]
MDLLGHFQRQFAYDAWANEQALASLREGAPPERSLRYMAHIVAAEWLWMGRIKLWKQEFPVWPEWTRQQCEAQAGKLPPLWQDLIRGIRPAGFDQPTSYTNSKGEVWASALGDILTHVLLHSAHHRGQIAADLRAAGLTPATTDYIHAVRQGFVR